MQKIFSNATGVIAWLGLSNTAFDGSFFQEPLGLGTDEYYSRETSSLRSRFRSRFRSRELLKDTHKTNVLSDIAMRPYWTRLWIVQEQVLAKDVVFWTGRHHFSLLELLDMMNTSPWVRVDFMKKLLTDVRKSWKSKNLAELVDDYGSLHCQDPRDSVYALLGLADLDSSQLMVSNVRYEESLMAFFSRALGACAPKWPFLFADNLATILGLYTDRPALKPPEETEGSVTLSFRCCGLQPVRQPSKDSWTKSFSGKLNAYRIKLEDEPSKTLLAYFRADDLSSDNTLFELGPHSQKSAFSHVVSYPLDESDNLKTSAVEFDHARWQSDIDGLRERHMKELDEFSAFIIADCACELVRQPKTGQRYLRATIKVEDLIRFLLDSGIAYDRAAERLSSKRDTGQVQLGAWDG